MAVVKQRAYITIHDKSSTRADLVDFADLDTDDPKNFPRKTNGLATNPMHAFGR